MFNLIQYSNALFKNGDDNIHANIGDPERYPWTSSIYESLYLSIHLPTYNYLSIFIYRSIYIYIDLSIYLFIYLYGDVNIHASVVVPATVPLNFYSI
jgi:hypothetical protein